MTGSKTQIQTAMVLYVWFYTYLRYQSHHFVGWGYGEARGIRGEARCSYQSVFFKLTFTFIKMMAEVCSVFGCKVVKGFPKDLKMKEKSGFQWPFFSTVFKILHKNIRIWPQILAYIKA